MSVSTSVIFSTATCVRDTVAQAASEVDGSSSATMAAEDAGQGECFDVIMNSLLNGVRPADTAVTAATGLQATLSESLPELQPESLLTGDTAVDAAEASIAAMAACLPAPPAVDLLPAGGKVLPCAKDAAAIDDIPATDDLLLMLTPGQIYPLQAAGAVDNSLPVVPSGGGGLAAPIAAPDPAGAEVTNRGDLPAPIPSLPAPLSLSPAPVEVAVRDPAAGRTDTLVRTEQGLQQRSDTPLPALDAGTDHTSSQGGGSQGQAHLQEMLAKIGGLDGTARNQGDVFKTLLQGTDTGTAGNPAALTYTQPGAAGAVKDQSVASLLVHTPLHYPEWSDEVSQRIRWVIGNQMQSAVLKINPPQLGPIEVHVSVDPDQQMTVTLTSQHALVRETLQESIPRLRDLMNEHGFSAVNVDVSQHSSSDGRKPAAPLEADPAARAETEATDMAMGAGLGLRREIRGIVDYYA